MSETTSTRISRSLGRRYQEGRRPCRRSARSTMPTSRPAESVTASTLWPPLSMVAMAADTRVSSRAVANAWVMRSAAVRPRARAAISPCGMHEGHPMHERPDRALPERGRDALEELRVRHDTDHAAILIHDQRPVESCRDHRLEHFQHRCVRVNRRDVAPHHARELLVTGQTQFTRHVLLAAEAARSGRQEVEPAHDTHECACRPHDRKALEPAPRHHLGRLGQRGRDGDGHRARRHHVGRRPALPGEALQDLVQLGLLEALQEVEPHPEAAALDEIRARDDADRAPILHDRDGPVALPERELHYLPDRSPASPSRLRGS